MRVRICVAMYKVSWFHPAETRAPPHPYNSCPALTIFQPPTLSPFPLPRPIQQINDAIEATFRKTENERMKLTITYAMMEVCFGRLLHSAHPK